MTNSIRPWLPVTPNQSLELHEGHQSYLAALPQALLITLTLVVSLPLAGGQDLRWANEIMAYRSIEGEAVAVDAAGYVYTVGHFEGTFDFDPGPGVFNLSSPAGWRDVFVLKTNSAGTFEWARSFTAGGDDKGFSIAVDGTGNVYTCGSYEGTLDLDPGPGQFLLTQSGPQTNGFVSKLDSAGNFVWGAELASNDTCDALDLAIDNAGDVVVVGGFEGTTDLNPAAPAFFVTPATAFAAYTLKLDSNGAFIQASIIDGAWGRSVALDALQNIHMAGVFYGTIDLDPGPGVSNASAISSQTQSFVLKLDSLGTFLWGGPYWGAVSGIACDVSGNVALVGAFRYSGDFDPGPGVVNLTSAGSWDAFVLSVDSTGVLTFARSFGNAEYDAATSAAFDPAGTLYTTGYFRGTTDFDPGPGVFSLAAPTITSFSFVSMFSRSGGFLSARSLGGPDALATADIAVDTSSNIYLTGIFVGTVDLNPGPGSYNLVHPFPSCFFCAGSFTCKLGPPTNPTIGITQPQGMGTGVVITNSGLVPGNTYFNVASLEPCLSGPGTGLPNFLGICLGSAFNTQQIVTQLLLPVETPPFHFVAPATDLSTGPYMLSPMTLEAVCFDYTGGILGAQSPVVRITVQ